MKNHKEIYSKQVLELYKKKSNFGILKNSTHKATESDSICGDELTVHLFVKEGRIKNIKFGGSGCAFSMVAASLISEKIKEMKIKDIKNIGKDDIIRLFKTKIAPSRIKCVLLPLKAIKKSLK